MFENIKKYLFLNLSEKNTKILALFVAFIEIIILFILAFNWTNSHFDDLEHIHASFLVGQGKIPYRDFFEHHHPLLWFLFAPITKIFYNNAYIYYAAHIFSAISSIIAWFFVYKIVTEFLSNIKTWILSVIFVVFFAFYGREHCVEFRPDICMYATFWIGLYYYLLHLKTDKILYLSISFSFFMISILFLQKIVILLFFLGLYTLYLLLKKQISIKNLLIATIPALGILAIFISYLILTGSFEQYLLLNFELNSIMGRHYGLTYLNLTFHNIPIFIPFHNGYGTVQFYWIYVILSYLTICIIPLLFKKTLSDKEKIYRQIISLMFLAELGARFFTFSPAAYYFNIFPILSAIIILTVFIDHKNNIKNYFSSLLVIIYLLCSTNYIVDKINIKIPNKFVEKLQYIIDNSENNDIVMNGLGDNVNIFNKDADYIWFGINYTGYIYNVYYNDNRYNINEIIKTKKPRFIETKKVILEQYRIRQKELKKYNFDALKLYNIKKDPNLSINDIIVNVPEIQPNSIDMEYIKKYYEPTPYENLWMRKDNISE